MYDLESDKNSIFSRKNSYKRNNLVLFNENEIADEKIKYNKKNIHPLDALSLNSSKTKNRFKKEILTTEEKNIYSEYNFDEDNKDTISDICNSSIRKEKKARKKSTNKKSLFGKKEKQKKEKEKDDEENEYEQNIVVAYKDKNKIKNKKTRENTRVFKQNTIYSINSEELLMMNYEEARKKDKRNWTKMYWSYIIEKHFVINIFVSEAFLDLRPIKINVLFFRLEIIFGFNALFYSDSYISKTYYND